MKRDEFRRTVFDSTEPVCRRGTITNCPTHTLSSSEEYILFLKSVFSIDAELAKKHLGLED